MEEVAVTMGKKDSLKSLLMRAWRERWDEQAWGIAIKQILPRGVSGDVYDLAPTMLQLSTGGPAINTIIFRYIKHSLCSGIISHQAVLEAVSGFRSFDKVHCVSACLGIVAIVESQVQCRGKQEECMALACSVLALVEWLSALAEAASASPAEPERPALLARLAGLADSVARNSFLTALLYLGRLEDPVKAGLVTKVLNHLGEELEELGEHQSIVRHLRTLMEYEPSASLWPSTESKPVVPSVHCLLQVELTCFRVRPPQALADRLLLLQQTQGMSARDLYYNIVRTCCDGLSQSVGTDMGRYWVQFTYHRLPKLMVCLHSALAGSGGPSTDLAAAFWRLVSSGGQLDLVDLLYNRDNQDTLELLLKEMTKTEVLSEQDLQRIMEHRAEVSRAPRLRQLQSAITQNCSSDSPTSILRADPTVKSILNTMEVQQQEAGISKITTVLFHMLGPSQHLVIGAAVGIGKVQLLMKHLIMLNSLRTSPSAESPSIIKNQAILFEVTFLIVMTTVKNYGLEALPPAHSLSCPDTGAEPFIQRWIRLCYRPMSGRSVLQLTGLGEPGRFTKLYDRLMTPGASLLVSTVRWDEVCLSVPAFIYWLLLSWCNGSVSAEQVQTVVDNMNRQFACLSVCVVVFLNSVLQSSNERLVQKARLLVNMYLAAVPADSLPTADQAPERLALAQNIMHHVLDDFLPRDEPLRGAGDEPSPLLLHIRQLWETAVGQGSLSASDVTEFRRLLARGGAVWFVSSTVGIVLDYPFERERERAEQMALAVFHLDLPLCALALAWHVLVDFFGTGYGHAGLSEPKLACLARLTVTLLLLAADGPAPSAAASSEYQWLSYQLLTRPAPATPPTPDLISADEYERPLAAAAADGALPALARACRLIAAQITAVAYESKVTVWTFFAVQYITEATRRGGQRMHKLLGSLTLAAVWHLMCASPASFTPDMMARLLDVHDGQGRKMAAKVLCQLQSLQVDDREDGR
ncbi:mediator of RNA polymerase II transcription subunit 24-like [Pollicipes pollicipes]|uniref:mediator of RNA polymerase II transcription subunit 24-like n=1 Tax=Pollicipes pollicipes TaxID=41117 RepID=UPI001884ECF6|nr:mediator of RNA polymerase II transcription subunit 24-like [Pollicipes pollicipes]XP_037075238.1 mediator of RNA polymerase II transcription subunit 24-like [Pollicipes pollicipes]XP_037075239.1 mediator of RNA polymerase II transcription subunit 24-like [Pollicipes pollicipes]